MAFNVDELKPTPSDFANYVYCGISWILSKTDDFRKNTDKHPKSQSALAGLLGKQNEHKCIEKVIKDIRGTNEQILYNGTGNDNYNFLTAEISGITMDCKPDLIIENKGHRILYEFKSTREFVHLIFEPFESIHAQVWCYTALKGIQVDKYILFRYYVDPFEYPPDIQQLTPAELDTAKFLPLFKKYLEAIAILETAEGMEDGRIIAHLKDTIPKEKEDIRIKCSHCPHRGRGNGDCRFTQAFFEEREFLM